MSKKKYELSVELKDIPTDDLDDLGIQYPDMSDVDLTDTNEIIYSFNV